jgi:hypothetical protein
MPQVIFTVPADFFALLSREPVQLDPRLDRIGLQVAKPHRKDSQ